MPKYISFSKQKERKKGNLYMILRMSLSVRRDLKSQLRFNNKDVLSRNFTRLISQRSHRTVGEWCQSRISDEVSEKTRSADELRLPTPNTSFSKRLVCIRAQSFKTK